MSDLVKRLRKIGSSDPVGYNTMTVAADHIEELEEQEDKREWLMKALSDKVTECMDSRGRLRDALKKIADSTGERIEGLDAPDFAEEALEEIEE